MTIPAIYTAENCSRCEHIKRVLQDAGIQFEERSAEEWLTGSTFHPDWREQRLVEARAMLAMHDDVLPVIDAREDLELATRLIELWAGNPIPHCRDDICVLRR